MIFRGSLTSAWRWCTNWSESSMLTLSNTDCWTEKFDRRWRPNEKPIGMRWQPTSRKQHPGMSIDPCTKPSSRRSKSINNIKKLMEPLKAHPAIACSGGRNTSKSYSNHDPAQGQPTEPLLINRPENPFLNSKPTVLRYDHWRIERLL